MNFKLYKISILASLILTLTACSIDDIKPVNQLTEDNVITNEASAKAALNGIYNSHRSFDISTMTAATGYYGASYEQVFGVFGDQGFIDNNPQNNSELLASIYTYYYGIINDANFFIELVEAGKAVGLDEAKKKEMLGEAYYFRAQSHLYLLRIFGEFYNTSSKYGVVTNLKPVRSKNNSAARSSVQETYDAIIADLEYAANNAGTGKQHLYVSATTARALLAKAQLYSGDFANAATNALKAINNGDGYALEANYADIYKNRWNSSEVLFVPFVDGLKEADASTGYLFNSKFVSKPSKIFKKIADASDGAEDAEDQSGTPLSGYDSRFLFTYGAEQGAVSPNGNGKYPFNEFSTEGGEGNTFYYLRLAEVYLIYAEAEARKSGGDLNAALDKLNEVRQRANAPLKSLSDKATLLEDIRKEKMIELCSENTESYYDLVRYDQLGDLEASSFKKTLTDNKFIFPIPIGALAGNPQLVPNP